MLTACPVPGKVKSAMLCKAFIAGAPVTATGFVFYGVKAGNYAQWVAARKSGLDWYFIDNSYFDDWRGIMFRVTKNRLQHNGIGTSDGRRLANLNDLGEPIVPSKGWRVDDTGYVLVIEQSLDHYKYVLELKEPERWLERTLARIDSRPAMVRRWTANKPELAQSFKQDLAGAGFLVTHTSAAAVEAVIAGVPVQCDQQCTAHLCSYLNPIYFTQFQYGLDDRLRWAQVLADNQWTIGEMERGHAWRVLNPT